MISLIPACTAQFAQRKARQRDRKVLVRKRKAAEQVMAKRGKIRKPLVDKHRAE
jgi:hypothetical protein